MRAVEILDNYSGNYAEDIKMATETAITFFNEGIVTLLRIFYRQKIIFLREEMTSF